jgi:hypothetical protein
MVLRREQSKNAFEHVLTVVFGLTQADPLVQALAADEIEDMEDLFLLHPRQIEALSIVDATTGTATPIRKLRHNLVHVFQHYVIHRQEIGDPIGENWTNITQDQFDTYRRCPEFIASQKGTTITPSVTGTATQVMPPPQQPRPVNRDPVNDFKKGINSKRDVSTYPTLKDENQWDNWNRSLKSLAHAHDIYHVIDGNYTPTTAEEIDLFDQGKALVCAHEADFDA